MIAKEFTPAMWRHAEFFYNTVVTSLLIGGLFLGLIGLIILLYVKQRKWTVLCGVSVAIVGLGGVFLIGNARYKEYLSLSKVVAPNLRDRERNFLGYNYYSESTMGIYQHIQNKEGIARLGIYEGKPVERDITYLGSAYGAIYFKVGAQQYYLRRTPEFVEGTTAKLVGQYYHLQQSAKEFEAIGFLPQTNHYLEKIVLPKDMESLSYVQQEGKMSKDFTTNQADWAVGKE